MSGKKKVIDESLKTLLNNFHNREITKKATSRINEKGELIQNKYRGNPQYNNENQLTVEDMLKLSKEKPSEYNDKIRGLNELESSIPYEHATNSTYRKTKSKSKPKPTKRCRCKNGRSR
jgi:hypothetical protein